MIFEKWRFQIYTHWLSWQSVGGVDQQAVGMEQAGGSRPFKGHGIIFSKCPRVERALFNLLHEIPFNRVILPRLYANLTTRAAEFLLPGWSSKNSHFSQLGDTRTCGIPKKYLLDIVLND